MDTCQTSLQQFTMMIEDKAIRNLPLNGGGGGTAAYAVVIALVLSLVVVMLVAMLIL